MAHGFNVRVYYEDTDAAGVVYYANYLKFAERARTEALRNVGINQNELLEKMGIGFVVHEIHAKYFKPAKLDDLLTITTKIHDIKRASLTLAQEIFREEKKVFALEVTLAIVGKNFSPQRLSSEIRDKILMAFEITKKE